MRLAVEPQPRGEEQQRRHRLRLEHDLVVPRAATDTGSRPASALAAARAPQAVPSRSPTPHEAGLGVAVGRVVATHHGPVDPVQHGQRRPGRRPLAGRRGQRVVQAPGRAVTGRLEPAAGGHERSHDLGPAVGCGARRPVVPVIDRAAPPPAVPARGSRGRPAAALPRPGPAPPARPGPRRRCGWSTPGPPGPPSTSVRVTCAHVLGDVLVDAAVGEPGQRRRPDGCGDQRLRPAHRPAPARARRPRRPRPASPHRFVDVDHRAGP